VIKPADSTPPKEEAPVISQPLPSAIPSSSVQPKPPVEPKTPPVDPAEVAKGEIRQLIEISLSKVFDDRSADELKELWPQIDGKTLDSFRNSFKEKAWSSLARKYSVLSITLAGDTASTKGVWNGFFYTDGKLRPNQQRNWTATLAKINGRWRLTDLK